MTLPSWMSEKGKKRAQNAASRAQEHRHARKVGGKVQAGSGSSWRAKGDVKSSEFMDELKFTSRSSFSITNTIINKLLRAAGQSGREPRLIIDFQSLGVRAVVTFEDL